MSLVTRWVRRLQGLHPMVEADVSREERKLVAQTAKELERRLNLKFRREVLLTVRQPSGSYPSGSLARPVGIVMWPGVGPICGLAQPSGRMCFVVAGPGGKIEHPMIQHELAECLAIQHGLRAEGKKHTPKEWSTVVWGWI